MDDHGPPEPTIKENQSLATHGDIESSTYPKLLGKRENRMHRKETAVGLGDRTWREALRKMSWEEGMCLSLGTHNCTLRLVFQGRSPLVLHLAKDQGAGDELPVSRVFALWHSTEQSRNISNELYGCGSTSV